jgi:hypothetical protein
VVKDVLRGSLAQITTEQKHGVLQRPSPLLCHHPGHYSTIPGAVGARDDKTSPRPLLCDLQPSVSLTLELTYER